jgi:glycosyltransferase involved in cell wall biosynthesis
MTRDIQYRTNIGVDMHVVDGPHQGSRTYMVEIFSRVILLCPQVRFYLFCADAKALTNISPSFSMSNVVIVSNIFQNPILRLVFQFPYLQVKYKLDFLHVQYILPVIMFCRGIVSLHDILFESNPEYFSRSFLWRSKILMRWSARRANQIFTISSFSKEEICNRYSIPADKVALAFCGVATNKFYPGADGIDYLSARGLLPKSYVLSVGRLDPRKNLVNLVQGYSFSSMQLPLIIVGQDGLRSNEVYSKIEKLGIGDKVIVLNDVGDAELGALYRHSSLFIFPSFAEGFGLPVLEAMASGVPVITSKTTSLTEVAEDAAILIDPSKAEDITRSLDTIFNTPDIAAKLVDKGFKQVERFSWSSSAEVIAKFYSKRSSD